METVLPSRIVLSLALLMVKVLCNPLTRDQNVKVTYAEIEALGASCYPIDSCNKNETNYLWQNNNCDCDESCSIYDTCCVDSEFKVHKESPAKTNLKCIGVYNSPGLDVFMIDGCKNDDTFDNLCFSDPEESNDPFLIVPVTSNLTGITYKNYFCALCNEEVDSTQLEFWDMEIWGNGKLLQNLSEPQLMFNQSIGMWTVLNGTSNEASAAVPVTLKIQKNWQPKIKYCSPNLISNCSSNWTDDDVERRCKDYMAIVTVFQSVSYRNPHCALCNFESLSNLQCINLGSGQTSWGIPIAAFAPSSSSRRPSVSIDIPLVNLFVLDDRRERCAKNMVYDKFANKCRCNSRIFVKENGKCVHKI